MDLTTHVVGKRTQVCVYVYIHIWMYIYVLYMYTHIYTHNTYNAINEKVKCTWIVISMHQTEDNLGHLVCEYVSIIEIISFEIFSNCLPQEGGWKISPFLMFPLRLISNKTIYNKYIVSRSFNDTLGSICILYSYDTQCKNNFIEMFIRKKLYNSIMTKRIKSCIYM